MGLHQIKTKMNDGIRVVRKSFGLPEESKNKGKVKDFFSQLSRGLMLPIAILPIAGLLLGIGGAISANLPNDGAAIIVANIIKSMSEVVFNILPLLFCIALTITFSKDRGASGFCSALAYMVFCSFQLPFFQYNANHELISIMWFHKDPGVLKSIVTTTLGFQTLQTSIFGGIVVGLLTSFIYNRISVIKLPTALDFFSGIRLVPIVLIPTIALLTLFFLIFWPWIGYVINLIGGGIQQAPAGSGGLLYGILGRSLQPFGLHHIPIILAFQTPFGGEIQSSDVINQLELNGATQQQIEAINAAFNGAKSISGDQNIWNFVNKLPFNTLPLKDSMGNITQVPVFDWFSKTLNVYPGRYTQDYPTYLGVCMGIGAAIIVTSDKANRKRVAPIIGSSMVVAFLTGITEPLEYTFLFCAPLLYYLIYVPLSGFSYMFMELAGAHVGVGFARGFIDLIIYGAIPILKGTQFYWAFVLALAEGSVAFVLFWILIKKMNLKTPGRGDNNFQLINKKTYQELKTKDKRNLPNNVDQRTIDVICSLGGLENIENVSACATRLRVSVKDKNKLDIQKAKELGSMGEVVLEKSVQYIFGGEAAILSEKINDIIDQNIDISSYIENNVENNQIENQTKSNEQIKTYTQKNNFIVCAPVTCEAIELENVDDEVFKNKLIGDGIAIIPKAKQFYSPLKNGKLSSVFDTKHCYIFENRDNVNVMMHIGIDSVQLKSSPFELIAKPEDKINLDTHIVNVDLEKLKKAKSMYTPIVVADKIDNMKIELLVKNKEHVKKGDPLFKVTFN